MKLTVIVGLANDAEGEQETVQIDSFVLLSVLHATLKTNGYVFEVLTGTNPSEVSPQEYEEACRELGLLFGFIDNALRSELSEEEMQKLH